MGGCKIVGSCECVTEMKKMDIDLDEILLGEFLEFRTRSEEYKNSLAGVDVFGPDRFN
jgi:hypothetical protein